MAARPSAALVLVGALASLGASYRTQNFVVEASTPQLAQQVAEYAEHYRREKAVLWLGQEMRTWGQPCPVRVSLKPHSGGATSFAFDQGRILSIDMHIEGQADRLLASVLPHEITHTVFAYYYRCPMPRWADEGGSVLSEDEQERSHHDHLVRQILNTPGRAIPLRRLFALREYPPDVMVLYAEGYSVTNFLVGLNDRGTFLRFVAAGMRGDWDGAVRSYYRYNTVEELERAWVQSLSRVRQGGTQLVSSRGGPDTERIGRVVVRQTVPPAQPILEAPQPVYRGAAPSEDGWDSRAAWRSPPPAAHLAAPVAPPRQPVQLLAPELAPAPTPPAYPRSPIGYSP